MMGLEACAGVTSAIWMEKYEMKNIEGAVVFSRNLEEEGNMLYPTKELGEFAYKNLQEKTLYSGQVGAGTRASHGQGIATGKVDGFNVLCIVVNNAVGDVVGEPVQKKTKTAAASGGSGRRKNTAITMVITVIGTTVTGTITMGMATVGGGAVAGMAMGLEPAGLGRRMAIGGFATK